MCETLDMAHRPEPAIHQVNNVVSKLGGREGAVTLGA